MNWFYLLMKFFVTYSLVGDKCCERTGVVDRAGETGNFSAKVRYLAGEMGKLPANFLVRSIR